VSTSASPLHRQATDGHPGQSAFAWKEELNARLREHRQRRDEMRGPGLPPSSVTPQFSEEDTAASRVAARVAARYRDAPSYSELLAASAEAAAVAAETAAAAAREAHIAAQAALQGWAAQQDQQALEDQCAAGNAIETGHDVFADPFFTQSRSPAADARRPHWEETAMPVEALAAPTPEPVVERPPASVTVAHHAPLPARTPVPERQPIVSRARALVDAFAEVMVPAAQHLPAKLIEFPRELIAAHRQRPHLAEGPLFEPEQPVSSLRIFEVSAHPDQAVQHAHPTGSMNADGYRAPYAQHATEPVDAMLYFDGEMGKQTVDDNFEEAPRRRGGFLFAEGEAVSQPAPVSTTPAPQIAPAVPSAPSKPKPTPMERASSSEDVAPLWKSKAARIAQEESGWSSIRLGEHPRTETAIPEPSRTAASTDTAAATEPSATAFAFLAPLTDRCMGALVDTSIVFGSFLLGVLVFTSCTVHPPAGKAALAVAALVLGAMGTFYGWLFMSYGGGSTPGMRYARIALCTFEDANPTRKELQNRIPATALALLPLGLGIIWALLDEDRLGWHDRMTRTYQRSYR
jgi:uncharacterized RDD family membrane protein YckC